jgi:hypothetical protein
MLYHPSNIVGFAGGSERAANRTRSNPAEQKQNQKDDDHEAQAATAVVAGAVEWTAAKSAETSKQDDDQDDEQNGSDRHEIVSECLCCLLQGKAAPCGAACHVVSVRKAPAE